MLNFQYDLVLIHSFVVESYEENVIEAIQYVWNG